MTIYRDEPQIARGEIRAEHLDTFFHGTGKNKKKLVGGLEQLLFFHIFGMSSSQLTFTFFRGVCSTTNQNELMPMEQESQVACVDGLWEPGLARGEYLQQFY